MIHIITKYKGNAVVIRDFDAFFDANVLMRNFTDLDNRALKKIDNAVVVDVSADSVKTPFGVTDIKNISIGCKVVLSYLHIRRNREENAGVVLDIIECGANALEVLFQCADELEDSDTVFLLRHRDNLDYCSDRDYSVNGEVYTNLRDGVTMNG